jgi:hypothetical protein
VAEAVHDEHEDAARLVGLVAQRDPPGREVEPGASRHPGSGVAAHALDPGNAELLWDVSELTRTARSGDAA